MQPCTVGKVILRDMALKLIDEALWRVAGAETKRIPHYR